MSRPAGAPGPTTGNGESSIAAAAAWPLTPNADRQAGRASARRTVSRLACFRDPGSVGRFLETHPLDDALPTCAHVQDELGMAAPGLPASSVMTIPAVGVPDEHNGLTGARHD